MVSLSKRLALCFAALALSACGGGGGGSGGGETPPDALSIEGAWQVAQMSIATNVADFEGHFGSWTFGPGDVATSLTRNANGSVDETPLSTEVYSLGDDGFLEITNDEGILLQGSMSTDRRVGLATAVLFGRKPTIVVTARQTSGSSAATLLGNYHRASLGVSVLGAFSSFSRATFDGVGLLDIQGDPVLNVGGLVFASAATLDAPYEIDPNGTLRTGTPWGVGGTTADGEFAFTGGPGDQPTGTAVPLLTAMVKASETASAATLRGTYAFARIAWTASDTRTMAGSMSADGAGMLVESPRVSNAGGLVVYSFGVMRGHTYTVSGDGTLELSSDLAAADSRGAVSPSGRYAVLTVPGGEGVGPSLTILVRTSLEP